MTVLSEKQIESLRGMTPSIGNVIYLNHASASLVSTPVIASMHASLDQELARGVNRVIREMTPEIEQLRQQVAVLVGGQAHNIAFVDTTTSGWTGALEALTQDRRALSVVTVRNEWNMNILSALSLQRRGLVRLSIADNDAAGSFDPTALASAARGADVVAVPVIPSSCGVINPLAALRAKLEPDTLIFADAAQAAGQIPLHAASLGADVLVFPSRKWLRGPKGIAVLYVSDRALSRMSDPFRVSGQGGLGWRTDDEFDTPEDARKFESYEFNPALRAGLRAAVDMLTQLDPQGIMERIASLGEYLKEAFSRHGLPRLFEHRNTSGIWTFDCPQISNMQDLGQLRDRGLELGAISGESNRPVLLDRGAMFILRLSLHYLNTKDDIDQAVSILADATGIKKT